MQTFLQDLRYGARMLTKNWGFTLIAVLTLGIGIGANTAIFSLINSVLLRPLAYHDPERLVVVWEDATFANFPRNTPAPANYADWKAENQVFDDIAATGYRSFNLTGDGEPEKLNAFAVTANFFPLLGVQPAIGRTFNSQEDSPGANHVVVLSYALWQSRYGGDPSILGRNILLNGESYTVLGVMPSNFQFLQREIRAWVPIAFSAEELANRGSHYLTVVARMKEGVTLKQAQTDMSGIMQHIAEQHPNNTFNGKLGAVVLPLHEQVTGNVSQLLVVLLVATGFVLLIACANIANLLLSRAVNRQREIAVRAALGASRLRIARQLVTESVLLAATGSLLGLGLTWWSFGFLQQLIPQSMALATNLTIDLPVLGFTILLSLLTGIIFGLAPALQASKVDLNETLKQSTTRTGSGTKSNRLRAVMVVSEIALALVLLVGAGLLIRTFYKLTNQYAVLKPEAVLTVRTSLPLNKYAEHRRRVAFYDQVLERVRALPGVVSVGYTTSVPLAWKGGTSGFYPEGTQQPLPGLSYDSIHRQVSDNYLQTMGIPLKQGRYFESGDTEQSQPVAIVNETMAREYWPNENPIGKRFKLGDPDEDIPWRTIVGIVADVRQMGVDEVVKAEMYMPYQQVNTQQWFAPRDLVIRTTGQPMSLVSAIRSEVQAVDPQQPISSVMTLEDILGEETAPRRLGVILLTTFATVALLLASLGIYGVIYYFVAQHTQEIGIRLALGASRKDILGLVLKKGLVLTATGIAAGLVGAFLLTGLMQSLLYDVRADDPATFAAIALILSLISLIACYIPARRATRVDPMVALRYE
jgi:putative ABC transport system permease protein